MRHHDARRRQLTVGAVSLMALTPLAKAGAAALLTPGQTAGPFYPQQLPLDHDNDLVRVRGRSGLAKGEITNVIGVVRDQQGRPLSEAHVEIWQCDANGRYHHPWDRRDAPLDENFQGYGTAVTGADGAYRFRTIRPVSYPGRAPHIHFAVQGRGVSRLTTQMYVAGAPENRRDGILNRITDPGARESVIVRLEVDPYNPAELMGRFDIVLAADGRFQNG